MADVLYPSILSPSTCRQQLVYHDMDIQDSIPVYIAALVSKNVLGSNHFSVYLFKTLLLVYMIQLFFSHILGLLDISVKDCDEPPNSRLLRRVDPVFVQALKKQLEEDPSGIGIPPLAVVCKDVVSKELFEMRLKDVYRYEIQGGLHGIKACQELNAENDTFTVVSCHVYAGLTDEEALWLASRHNANGQFQHNMTHRDYVSSHHI